MSVYSFIISPASLSCEIKMFPYLLPVAMKSFLYSILKPSSKVTDRVFTSITTAWSKHRRSHRFMRWNFVEIAKDRPNSLIWVCICSQGVNRQTATIRLFTFGLVTRFYIATLAIYTPVQIASLAIIKSVFPSQPLTSFSVSSSMSWSCRKSMERSLSCSAVLSKD